MPDKYSKRHIGSKVIELDFNSVFLLMMPFWLGMVFINAKVMVEINKEWDVNKHKQKLVLNGAK
ncbi:MAG: hypothetical protein ACRD38_04780 [Nitrososphaerales archaeon]